MGHVYTLCPFFRQSAQSFFESRHTESDGEPLSSRITVRINLNSQQNLSSANLDYETGTREALHNLEPVARVFHQELPKVYELACQLAARLGVFAHRTDQV